MSGGSQHNPNGRQSQLGSGWSPLQLQVANLLARAPQAHMASERGVTWHTPTPPPHLYHVPAPSPPDPLQAMKAAGGNSVFRHTATPPELYRHTPTPPDKHLIRHTPSPGDIKASAALPPVELYSHLGPGRDKLVRADELLAYARGVDLSLSGGRAANGAPHSPAPPAPAPAPPALAPTPPALAPPALSVRDAPTINSLIARAQPRHPHARVDALLERLIPSPVSPHSVIVHSRAAPTPSPPSSNEDSADSCGAPPGSKRKRKPERTVRLPTAPPPPAPPALPVPPAPRPAADAEARVPPQRTPPPNPAAPAPAPAAAAAAPAPPAAAPPLENGDVTHASPCPGRAPSPAAHARRKTRSGSAETIDDIAAMIAEPTAPLPAPPPAPAPAVTVDKLRSVLAGPPEPEPEPEPASTPAATSPAPPSAPAPAPAPAPPPAAAPTPPPGPAPPTEPATGPAAAPRRRSARGSDADAPNVPVESPSEAKPAEPEASDARTAEPAAVSFVEVENQLEKMFAGLEEEPRGSSPGAGSAPPAPEPAPAPAPPAKRRRSAPARHDRRAPRGHAADGKKQQRKKTDARRPKKGGREASAKDAYDSGSNASSSRSRGPYIQIRGPRDSPLSVSVMNNMGCEEEEAGGRRKLGEELRGARGARGLHASTLGLRYDATTPDATWLCAFCHRGPHAESLGDLFGPYALDADCDEYRALDEATRRRYRGEPGAGGEPARDEAWLHEACGVWAPGLVAGGARLWGLASAVWAARGQRCAHCAAPPAPLACAARACRARAHLPCARTHGWSLCETEFRALCPHHAPAPP